MPITPFHLGPGLAFKAVSPSRVSFMVFGFTQVLIDLEALYWMGQGTWPVHRFLHTWLGAAVVVLVGVGLGRPLCLGVLRLLRLRYRALPGEIPWRAAWWGAGLGAFSHVGLDSIMHGDMLPFAPFSGAKPLYLLLSIENLHILCLLLGVAGGVVLYRRSGMVISR